MASHGTDQTIVQRLLAARGERDGRRALLASGVMVAVQFTVFSAHRRAAVCVLRSMRRCLGAGERTDRVLPTFFGCARCPWDWRDCCWHR